MTTTTFAGRLAAIALVAGAATSGCRPAERPPDSHDAAPRAAAALPEGVPPLNPALAGAEGTLTVWLAADYAGAPMFEDLNRHFERAYPRVKVKLLGVPWPNMPTKVKTAIIGGKPPDVAHYHPFALGAQGFAEDMTDLWQAWGAEAAFMPGALDDARWRGRVYGMPLDLNCTVLVYNKRLLAQRGVAPPGEDYGFADWQRDLGRLTDADQQAYGLGLSSSPWHTYAFVLANGGDVLREEAGKLKATFTEPKTVEAIRFLTALGHTHHFGPTPTTKAKDYEDATTLFTVGKVAMIYTGPWDFATIKKSAPDLEFGVSRFPAGLDGVRRGSVQGGGGLFVPKGARHRALAFEWMKWAVSDRYAKRLVHDLGRFPVKRAHYADPHFDRDPHLRTFVSALEGARPFRLEAYPQAYQAFEDAVKASFYGEDPARALARAQRVAQLAIDAVEGQ